MKPEYWIFLVLILLFVLSEFLRPDWTNRVAKVVEDLPLHPNPQQAATQIKEFREGFATKPWSQTFTIASD